MNWFKHYANADKDSRLQRLKTDYGFWGMGVYWSILERVVCYGEGCYPRNELMGMKLNRRDTGVIKAVLDRYDLFLTDEFGMVRCIESVQQSGTFVPENDRNVHECGTEVPTLCTDSECEKTNEVAENKEDSPESLAHTHVEEKREEKKREEENTLLNPPCEEVDDSVDKGRVDELTVSCHPEQSEGSVNASNRDDTGGRNQILHSVNSVQDDKASDNNTIPRNSVPSVSSVVCSSIIHELRTNRSWQEAVCITSGYGALLMRHFDRAVDIFLQHVKAGADEVELSDRRRAMNYFRNFTRLSHPAGRRLKEELERADSPPQSPQRGEERSNALLSPPLGEPEGASPFEDPPGPNGERSYHGGRPLPPDAPPRPSPQAEWDEAEEKWWEGWTLQRINVSTHQLLTFKP